MEVAKVYSELTGKGLHLLTHEGKIRVWPKEKLTKKDRELLKAYKEELLVLPFLKKRHLGGEFDERCEPNFKVFSAKLNKKSFIVFNINWICLQYFNCL